MTNIEKGVYITIVLLLYMGVTLNTGLKEVEKAGGWSEVFIDMGKEIKHIKNEINKD